MSVDELFFDIKRIIDLLEEFLFETQVVDDFIKMYRVMNRVRERTKVACRMNVLDLDVRVTLGHIHRALKVVYGLCIYDLGIELLKQLCMNEFPDFFENLDVLILYVSE
tara:strand:- start:36 stop:362 length:327 start_codon:yes stop_codon:yes gene_type:complete